MPESFRPLAGVRVLDLSRLLPGPLLTRLLADLGADVIKVESREGDTLRFLPPLAGNGGAAFGALNWGKRSVVLDLKAAAGVELFLAMARRADVVVESFRPGVLDRLGVGFAALQAVNPRLVLCSISGYGQAGPLRDVPGHDLDYLARSGALSLFGPADRCPVVPGIQIADIAGGSMSAAVGLLGALIERGQSGRGRHLDISMTRSVLPFVAVELARRAADAPEPRGAGVLTGGMPAYRVYRTRDQRFMALGAIEPKFFAAFCARAGRPDLAGSGLCMGEEGARVASELEQLFAERTQAEWVELLHGVEACCEPVRTPEEAVADPGVGAVRVRAAGLDLLAIHVGAQPPPPARTAVPALGEHGLEVVRELGVGEELVERATAAGAFLPGGTPSP